MPKFTVMQHRTITAEWYDIEADTAQEAIEQVRRSGEPSDDVTDDDIGDFSAEKQHSFHTPDGGGITWIRQ